MSIALPTNSTIVVIRSWDWSKHGDQAIINAIASLPVRLRAAREESGLTQKCVADRLGLHRPAISEMEAGRRKVTSEELVIMAQLYGVSVSWLACAVDDSKPNGPEWQDYPITWEDVPPDRMPI